METYCCFCTLLNVNTSSHSISLGVVLVPHFVTSSTLKRLGLSAESGKKTGIYSTILSNSVKISDSGNYPDRVRVRLFGKCINFLALLS